MKDIPLNARVESVDGPCGQSTRVIVNPETLRVTHFVVRQEAPPQTQRLVPVDQVVETTRDLIRLRCTGDELGKMKQFLVTEYRQVEIPRYIGGQAGQPSRSVPEIVTLPVEEERVPAGGQAIREGARIEATDGKVGRVDELLLDSDSGQITHLVLREAHMWGVKDVALPVSVVEKVVKGTVYLKLDKATISGMLAIPAKRGYGTTDVELVVLTLKETSQADKALQTLRQAVKDGAISDHNVLAGPSYTPAVLVHPGVDGNTVVPCGERAAFNDDIATRIWIEAISVWSCGLDRNATYQDVLAINRMHRPHGSIQKRDALD